MGESIVVYNAYFPKKSGRFFISQTSRRLNIVQNLGRFFLALSFVSLTLFLAPIISSELKYRLHFFQREVLKKPDEHVRSKFSLILSPYENQFELVIPKIGVKTQVLTNVDANNKEEYKKALADYAAHAQGTNLPGQGGMVFIFGHSTNSVFDLPHYNPVFYLLNKLELGDEVGIIHQGKVYIYQVAERKVVESNDLSEINSESNQEKLILLTCWPPGTTWKRFLVIAYPIT